MNNVKKAYMIRRKSDGLYSTGGTAPSFNKKGKVWSSIGALKNHIIQGVNTNYNRKAFCLWHTFADYKNCEIIELVSVITENQHPLDIMKVMIEHCEKKKDRYHADYDIEI